MAVALQVLVTGAAAGAVYGLVAVGHALIFRLTGVVHFAYGDLVGLGVFATLLLAAGTGPVTQTSLGGPRFALALAGGLLVCVAVAAASYFYAVEPWVLRGSTLGWVTATVAIAFAIRALIELFFDRPSYVFPDPVPFRKLGDGGFLTIGESLIPVRSFFVIGLGLLLAAAAILTLERTRFGRGLQAIASDVDGARLVGVPVRTLVALAFGLSGGLAALAAVAAAPSAPFDTQTGALLGVKGLVAALLVAFASPWSAFAAGLALGIVEAAVAGLPVFGWELGPEYREVLPLLVVLVFVALRPRRNVREVVE